MRILIVAAFFPPLNSIASLRPYSWAKWWSKAGHDVTVLTTLKLKEDNNLKLDCSGFEVIEIPIPVLSKIQQFSQKASPVKQNDNGVLDKGESIGKKIFHFFKKYYNSFTSHTGCLYACRFPDWHDLWIKRVIKEFLRSTPSCCDLLITTGGPYSVHRIGPSLKRRGLVKTWVVDWRDLWTQNHLYKGLRIFHPYERWLERKFHKTADMITVVSDGAAATLQTITKTPIKVVYNGFDKEDFSFLLKRARQDNEIFTIAYLGTLYKGFRDPEPLLKAVQGLGQEGRISPSDFHIVFAGDKADITDRVLNLGIEEYYTYRGFLPREASLQLQYDSDAVLFLEYTNPNVKGVLTGKLFEYLYISRSIWAVGVTDQTDAGELIVRTNSGVCLGQDVEKIKEYIMYSIQQKKKNHFSKKEKDMIAISQFDRRRQADLLLEYVAEQGQSGL